MIDLNTAMLESGQRQNGAELAHVYRSTSCRAEFVTRAQLMGWAPQLAGLLWDAMAGVDEYASEDIDVVTRRLRQQVSDLEDEIGILEGELAHAGYA